jgi:beta-1,4-mannosyl-glycoprotein beta-1,4-N-acetylglucosaminyltransferase
MFMVATTSLTRPLWYKLKGGLPSSLQPWERIFNYGFIDAKTSCPLYGFTSKNVTDNDSHDLYDGFIFSSELDLLEIRLNELEGLVAKFIIVESTRTFTNQPKPLWWRDYGRYQLRFSRFLKDIVHVILPAEEVEYQFTHGGKWLVEAHHRQAVFHGFIKGGMKYNDVMIVGDVDEIPRRSTVNVLKHCSNYPSDIVFELDTFIGGFHTFSSDPPKRNSAARRYLKHPKKDTDWVAHHTRKTNYLFSNSGWHCTWCFRYYDQYVWKMKSYSHHDRGIVKHSLLKYRISNGLEIHGLYPESYTWSNLIWRIARDQDIDSRRIYSTLLLPKLIQERPMLHPYLLDYGVKSVSNDGGSKDNREMHDPFLYTWKKNGRPKQDKNLQMCTESCRPICFFKDVESNVRKETDSVKSGICSL